MTKEIFGETILKWNEYQDQNKTKKVFLYYLLYTIYGMNA